jgi:hypothetical protein
MTEDEDRFDRSLAHFADEVGKHRNQMATCLYTLEGAVAEANRSPVFASIFRTWTSSLRYEEGPLCLICGDHEFRAYQAPPAAFLCVFPGEGIDPRTVIITAICEACAEPWETLDRRCMNELEPVLREQGMTIIVNVPLTKPPPWSRAGASKKSH